MQVDGVLVPVLVVLPEDGAGRTTVQILHLRLLGLPQVAQLLGALLVAPLPRGLKTSLHSLGVFAAKVVTDVFLAIPVDTFDRFRSEEPIPVWVSVQPQYPGIPS